MQAKSLQRNNIIALCAAMCLSLASYLTLRVMESQAHPQLPVEMMAEEVESSEALPDVQLLKKLMSKTLEFMLTTPRLSR